MATRRVGRALAFALACCALLHLAPARADDDLPGRVGRLALSEGGVLVASEYAGNQWSEAGVNHPITSGDSVWAPAGGRAEVDFGGGQLRLAGATNVLVSRLDEREIAVFVAEGTLVVRLRFLDAGEAARIDAPTAQIRLVRPGLYRIDVLPESQLTVVTVRDGEASVELPAEAIQALPAQTVYIAGQDPPEADLRNGVSVDGFDTWSADRDRYYERSRSVAYVSRQMVGVAELDEYGTWQTYPDYGAVWFPNWVGAGWAPYSDGYWIGVGAWGPTWVDAAPWGYAPFHYGRWAFIGGRWGWCPGGYVARPHWAPALVAWHGGPGWNVASRDGGPVYAWVPLGWRDPYLPPWRNCSQRCWTNFNQPYGVVARERPRTVPAHWANMRVPGALTAVPAGALAASRSIGRERLALAGDSAAAAPALASAPALSPGRDGRSLPAPAAAAIPAGARLPTLPATTYRAGRPAGYMVGESGRSPTGASPAAPGRRAGSAAGAAGAAATAEPSAAPTAAPARNTSSPRREPGLPVPRAPTARPVAPEDGYRAAPAPGVAPTAAPAAAPVVAPVAPAPRSVPVPPPAARVAPPTAHGVAPATAGGALPAGTPRPDRGIPMPPAAVAPAAPAGVVVGVPQVAAPAPALVPIPQGTAPAAPGTAGQSPGRPGQPARDAPAGTSAPVAPGPGGAPGAPPPR